MKEFDELAVDSDYSVKSSQDKTAEAAASCLSALFGNRIAARMKSQHNFAARDECADKSERKQTPCEVSAEVKMDYVVLQTKEHLHNFKRAFRIINLVGVFCSMPG